MKGTDTEASGSGSDWSGFSVRRGIGYFFAFLITLSLIDVFGVKKSVAFGSATLFNRYFANAYPHCIRGIRGIRDLKCIFNWRDGKQPNPRPESKDVSVVLWNDSMLDRSDMVWPLRMEAHAHVLETILAYEPKAVMVDIFFLDDPARRGDHSLDALLDIVKEYAESGVELYFLEPSGTRTIPTLRVAAGDDNILSAVLSHSPSGAYLGDGAASRVYRRARGAGWSGNCGFLPVLGRAFGSGDEEILLGVQDNPFTGFRGRRISGEHTGCGAGGSRGTVQIAYRGRTVLSIHSDGARGCSALPPSDGRGHD